MKDFDKSRSAGYLANHQARLFAQALAESINPMGLAPAQFQCLLELWREGACYRGVSAMLLRAVPVHAVYMPAYSLVLRLVSGAGDAGGLKRRQSTHGDSY